MRSRDEIITSMCYTQRHDYGIVKDPDYKHYSSDFIDTISAGMYQWEREQLWKQMAQLFDNDIAPHMEFRAVANSRNICDND
jgi:hypothetical protein